MTTCADRAILARALAREISRAPEMKRAPLALASVSQAGVFEGYASLFGVADLGRDVVERGAFSDTLRKRGAAGIKMLWQHDPAEPLGAWLSIEEDSLGLKVKGRLNLAVSRAREILSLMREGAVDGLSIGFRTQRAIADRKTGLRRLQKLDLWEISLVTFPMLPQARVTAVKRARESDLAMGDGARMRSAFDASGFEAKLLGLALERKFSADQPRDDLGRWTSGGAGDLSGEIQLAGDYSIGDLVTQFMLGGARKCVYQFDFGMVIVDGPTNLGCTPWAPSAAVRHGMLLNDN